MIRRLAPAPRSALRRLVLVALAVSWLLLQGIGLMHRSLHAGVQLPRGPAATVPVAAVDGFGHAAGDAACAAFDHAAWGAAASGASALACSGPGPAVAPTSRVAVLALAPQASGHLARGPPPPG